MHKAFATAFIFMSAHAAWGQTAANLRCEGRSDPLAIQTPAPRLSWEMRSDARGALQTAYRIVAAASPEALAADRADLWDSGKVSSGETLQLAYAGKPLSSGTQVFWKVKLWDGTGAESPWSNAGRFQTGIMNPADWKARWIGFPNDDGNRTPQPAPCFRKEFSLEKPIARASIHICGLGQYELSLNGAKVGDSVLAPAWTAYNKTCAYDTYDVTTQIKQGPNALGIMLGDGMYNVLRVAGRYTKFPLANERPGAGSLGVPKVIAQLHLTFTDGSTMTLGTDSTWKAARGPVLFSHIYGGEDYDARKEMPGWDSPSFADAAWLASAEVPAPGAADQPAALIAADAPPIKIQRSYKPVEITRTGSTWTIDFGQNLSGWPRLKVQGRAGDVIRMTPGELLRNGAVTQAQSGSPMWFSYTLKGGGVEEWRPKFSYYGFRYLQITGAVPPGQVLASTDAVLPRIEEITSEFIHADLPVVGKFESSDDNLNRIHKLINMAILSNAQSVLTDCPHREKLGWLEQSHLVFDGIAMNYDVSGMYAKICRDMRDSQTAAGLVPDIAPEFTTFSGGFRDSPEWGSAAIIDPWNLYLTYGDKRILAEQYPAMKKYAAYLAGKAAAGIVSHGLGDWYDIGPNRPGAAQLTTVALTATATYYHDLDILRQTAELLGHADDAKAYAADAARVRAAFNAKFFSRDAMQYDKGSQTSYAMPVALGLAEREHAAPLIEKLASGVKANQYRVTAGDVGFSYVVRTLTDFGHGDVMLNMMLQENGPGYVMQLKKGATTLTEAWDALASSSQNHLMLGHAEAWLYRGLAGIQNDPAGGAFSRFIIRPQFPGTLGSVAADYHSPRGMIRSAWKRVQNRITLTVMIPANTRAVIHVPAADPATILESGKPLREVQGITLEPSENREARLKAGAGTYVLTFALPE